MEPDVEKNGMRKYMRYSTEGTYEECQRLISTHALVFMHLDGTRIESVMHEPRQ